MFPPLCRHITITFVGDSKRIVLSLLTTSVPQGGIKNGRRAKFWGIQVLETTMTDGEMPSATLIELTADIASAYVSNNSVSASDLPALIKNIHGALSGAGGEPEKPVEVKAPAVSIKKSITDEYLICLEDGRRFKSLKRHLRTKYNLSPEEYRAKWNLPKDYPMVAPAYADARSKLAKQMGLGQGGRKPAAKPAVKAVAKTPAPRGRPRKV
jgi:predicted transcriptional regulator